MQRERRSARVAEAFMLIQTEVGRAEVVAKQLATLPGVLSSEYVTGPYDVVVRSAPRRSTTCGTASFRTYSRSPVSPAP